jgi:phage terminase large subunit
MKIKATNVLKRHLDAEQDGYKLIVHEGGSGSSKTWSVFQFFLKKAWEGEQFTLTILREKLTWIKASLLPDLRKMQRMYDFKIEPDININRQDQVYNINGSEFAFFGADYPQKFHGRRQDYFWINEAMEVEKAHFDQIEMRTAKLGVVDYNPSNDEHWVFDLPKRDDCKVIKSTMLDNLEFLPDKVVSKIKGYEPTEENIKQGTADKYMWEVYGLGKKARLEGLVFQDWDVVDDLPNEAKLLGYGMDFGYTNDPSTLVAVYRMDNELYLDELIYKEGLLNSSPNSSDDTIVKRLKGLAIDSGEEIIADSAEPKSIDEIHRHGFNIKGAQKGRDSINYGVNLMQGYKIHITQRSANTEKEFRKYKWAEDKTGKALNKPIDDFNHAIDAVRYLCMEKLGKQEEVKLTFV